LRSLLKLVARSLQVAFDPRAFASGVGILRIALPLRLCLRPLSRSLSCRTLLLGLSLRAFARELRVVLRLLPLRS